MPTGPVPALGVASFAAQRPTGACHVVTDDESAELDGCGSRVASVIVLRDLCAVPPLRAGQL